MLKKGQLENQLEDEEVSIANVIRAKEKNDSNTIDRVQWQRHKNYRKGKRSDYSLIF